MNKLQEKVQELLQKLKIREQKPEQEQSAIQDIEEYKGRLEQSQKMTYIRIGIIALVVVVASFLIKFLYDHHKYNSYTVTETNTKIDSGVTQYLDLNGKMMRYTADGVSLSSVADTTLWSDTFQMSVPTGVVFDDVAAIYDQKGNQVVVYNEDGRLGSFQTEYPIVKGSVSAEGGVALVLDGSDNTLINYYSYDGGLVASSSSNMRNPGYPIDLAVSEDGLYVAVSYFVPEGDTVNTYLAFYNFGDAGRNKEDNLVEGFRLEGILVPDIEYLDDDTLVAYREDGFTIYSGKNAPEEDKTVLFTDEIVSTFSDGDHLGFVFANASATTDHPFRMELYNSSGNRVMMTEFDVAYDEIKISENQIIMNNATQISIFSMQGVEKFTGNIEEGNIYTILKTGINRYMIAYNGGVISIRLR